MTDIQDAEVRDLSEWLDAQKAGADLPPGLQAIPLEPSWAKHLEHICVLLTEVLKRLDVMAERSGSTSSVEVRWSAATKDLPSKPAPAVKVYEGSDAPVEEAVEAYGRAVLLMEQSQMNGWRATVEAMSRD